MSAQGDIEHASVGGKKDVRSRDLSLTKKHTAGTIIRSFWEDCAAVMHCGGYSSD